MIQNLFRKIEALDKKLYFQMLALSIVGYYSVARIVQDIIYRGKFTQFLADAFIGHTPRPEPLEIPLYFLGFLVIPVLALGFYWLQTKGALKYLAGFFVVVALWKARHYLYNFQLPDFAFYVNYLNSKGLGQGLWLVFTKRIFVLRLAMVAAVVVYFLVRYFWKPVWTEALFKTNNAKILQKLEPATLILLGLLLFHPNLPYDEGHYNFMIGPVHDMLTGKPLLYETSNQYGVLNMYFLYAIFKWFGRISYEGFSLVLFVFYYAYYLALYYFIKSWLKSNLFAYLGLGLIVAVTYFLQVSPTLTAFNFPAMSPFRQGMYVPLLFLLLYYFRTKNSKVREAAIVTSAAAVFWNYDTGIALAIATFLTLGLGEKLRGWVTLARKYVVYGLAVFGLINLGNYLRFGTIPDWLGSFGQTLIYSKGLAQIPLPIFGFFEVFVLVYLGILLHFFYQKQQGQKVDPILFFLAVYGIFSFTYYIGVSAWNVFYQVSVPLILISLYFSYHYLQERRVFAIFASLMFFAALVWVVKIPVEFAGRDYHNFGHYALNQARDEQLASDAEALNSKYGLLARYPLLHLHGTKLLIYAGKSNWFPIYEIFQANTRARMRPLIDMVKTQKPAYLLVGKVRDEELDYFATAVLADYQPHESLKTLDVYRRK